FASLLGGHGERYAAFEVLRDIVIVSIPVAANRGHARLDRLAVGADLPHDTVVLTRLGCAIDVAGAQGVFLRVDPEFDEPAAGPDDPPARAIDPADPAGFSLEQDVVEFEHDPAVAPSVNRLPRGREEPGRQPPAGPQAELQGLVDQVGAPVVQ